MSTESFVIAITTTGAREVQRDLSDIGAVGGKSSKSLDELNAASRRTAQGVDVLRNSMALMRNLLVAFSFARATSGLVEGISQMQQMSNLLTTVTDNVTDNHNAFQRLGQAANEVRVPVAAFTALLVNLERSTAGYKISAEDAIKTTQSFMASFAISGLDETSVRNLTRDLKEVFNLGTVQGRIFRSIVMQDQEASLVLSKNIIATGKNAAAVNAQLDKMRSKGQQPDIFDMIVNQGDKGAFTGGDIQRAFLAGWREELDRMNQTAVTAGQGFIILHNDWLMFLEDLNNSTGLLSNVGKALVYVGDNLTGLLEIVGAVGAAFLVKWIGIPLISWLASVSIGIVTATFSLLGYAAAATVAGVAMAVDFIAPLIVAIGPVGALALAAAALAFTLTGLIGLVAGFVAPLMQLGDMGSVIDQAVSGPFKDVQITMKDLPKVFQGVINTLINDWRDIKDVMVAVWNDMLSGLTNAWNDWISKNRLIVKIIAGAAGGVAGMTAGGPFGAVIGAGAGILGAGAVTDRAAGGAPLPTDTSAPFIKALRDKMAANIASSVAGGANPGALKVNGRGGAPPDENAVADAQQRHNAAMDQLLGLLARFGSPMDKFNKDMGDQKKLLDDITSAHGKNANAMSQEEVQQVFLNAGYRDFSIATMQSETFNKEMQLSALGLGDSMKTYRGEVELAADALAKNNINLETFIRLSQEKTIPVLQQRMKNGEAGSGVELALNEINAKANPELISHDVLLKAAEDKLAVAKATDEYRIAQETLNIAVHNGAILQSDADRVLLEKKQNLLKAQGGAENGFQFGINEINSKKVTPFEQNHQAAKDIFKPDEGIQQLQTDIGKLSQMLNDGTVSGQHYTDMLRDMEIELLKTRTDALSGFQMGLLETQKTMNDFAATAAQTVKTAFQDLQDTLVTFFDTGKINAKKFVDDIIANLTKLAVQQGIMAPLANSLGLGGGGTFGAGGVLSSLFGGSGLAGALGTSGPLGSSSSNPVWIKNADSPLNGGMGGGGLGSGGLGGNTNGIFGSLFGGGIDASQFTDPSALSAAQEMGLSQGGLFSGIGDLFSSGGMLGGIGDLFGSAGAGIGAAASGAGDWLMSLLPLLAFADGGDFTVGGQGGTDSQFVPIRATPGEVVSVRHPGDSGSQPSGPTVINMTVNGARDPDTFQQSAYQVMSNAHTALNRARMRNGG